MKKGQKILIGVFVILFLSIWGYYIYLQNKALNEYTKRCDTIGWDICEKEYYETHYENGMLKK